MLISRFPEQQGYDPLDVPEFTYTGSSQIEIEEGKGWKIKFLTSGTFTLIKPKELEIDVFLVGGGGGGGASGASLPSGATPFAAGGGGGGYTKTVKKNLITSSLSYTVNVGSKGNGGTATDPTYGVVGKTGGVSLAFSRSASGGQGGQIQRGGNGGSGGGGQTNLFYGAGGSNGTDGGANGGIGQGSTTREFGESVGDLYSGGGGSSGHLDQYGGHGGEKGGGDGGLSSGWKIGIGTTPSYKGYDATFYGSSGGAGGVPTPQAGDPQKVGGNGYQGIVIIRNSR